MGHPYKQEASFLKEASHLYTWHFSKNNKPNIKHDYYLNSVVSNSYNKISMLIVELLNQR